MNTLLARVTVGVRSFRQLDVSLPHEENIQVLW